MCHRWALFRRDPLVVESADSAGLGLQHSYAWRAWWPPAPPPLALLVLPLLVLLLLLLLLFLGGYLRLGPLLLLPLRLALPLLAAVPRACVLRRLGGRAAAGKLWLMLWKITATAVIEESPIDTVGIRHVRALNACDGGHKFIESGGRAGMRAARRSPFARRPRGGADGRSHRRRRHAESAKEP